MSTNASPKVKIKDNFEKYRTFYPSPPKPESSPNFCLPSFREQHILRQKDNHFVNHLPSKVVLNDKQNDQLFGNHLKEVQNQTKHINNRIGFDINHTNHNIINGKSDDKSVKPKIIRHSTLDPVFNKNKVEKKCSTVKTKQCSQLTHSQNTINSPTNEEMYELIRQQDIHLQQISEQIQELLHIHKINENRDKKEKNSDNKRSVMTMTSMVFDNNENKSPLNKTRNRVSNGAKNKLRTPSTTSKDIRGLHLQTISECQTEPSDIDLDLNALNLTQSPTRSPYESASIERIRANHNNNGCDDFFYNHMIHNIESMLNNESSDETDESDRRSSCSPTPPQLKREPQHRKHQIQLQSEQTLYIKRLAAKYCIDDKSEHTKPKYKLKKSAQNQVLICDERTDLKVYGLAKNASIATKNYLEKYGLTYSPPKVQNSPNFYENHFKFDNHLNHNRHKTNRNRILDLESLKRQPKLT
jgi:hypothetical protein